MFPFIICSLSYSTLCMVMWPRCKDFTILNPIAMSAWCCHSLFKEFIFLFWQSWKARDDKICLVIFKSSLCIIPSFRKSDIQFPMRSLPLHVPADNDCIPDLCQNGGVCTDFIGSHQCECLEGFAGINCEIGRKLLLYSLKNCLDLVQSMIKLKNHLACTRSRWMLGAE